MALDTVAHTERMSTLAFPIGELPEVLPKWIGRTLCDVLGIGTIIFPCIPLPHPSSSEIVGRQLEDMQTILWGLTLRVTHDLLQVGNIQMMGSETPLIVSSQSRTWRLGKPDGTPYWAEDPLAMILIFGGAAVGVMIVCAVVRRV